ncbi:hypothetical protein LTR56_022162 [Elasticomyces elasticus]|nr:hypothetical protein LTR56_022162 [Elasticomyces elasticus]KAK3628619.1 hypothetical protein LTR22_022304 [Elasticomyces elasticus]KAK4913410.1 hypothetical protein LTR49_018298 [Elasticomyces elasticus]KAK5754616.1 hypothetical protein LTS12_015340 [Elasticomyces elasticus]
MSTLPIETRNALATIIARDDEAAAVAAISSDTAFWDAIWSGIEHFFGRFFFVLWYYIIPEIIWLPMVVGLGAGVAAVFYPDLVSQDNPAIFASSSGPPCLVVALAVMRLVILILALTGCLGSILGHMSFSLLGGVSVLMLAGFVLVVEEANEGEAEIEMEAPEARETNVEA